MFFNDPATTEIYTLSLHDALPILASRSLNRTLGPPRCSQVFSLPNMPATTNTVAEKPSLSKVGRAADRKSTRLNSSHANISYAVFCLKKNKLEIGRTHVRTQLTPL